MKKYLFIAMGFVFLVGCAGRKQTIEEQTASVILRPGIYSSDKARQDSLRKQAKADSLEQVRWDSLRVLKEQSIQYSLEKQASVQAEWDSLRVLQEQAKAIEQAWQQAQNDIYYNKNSMPKKIYEPAWDSQIVIIKPNLQAWESQYIMHPSVKENYCRLMGEIRVSKIYCFVLVVKLYDSDKNILTEKEIWFNPPDSILHDFNPAPDGYEYSYIVGVGTEEMLHMDFEEIPYSNVAFIKIEYTGLPNLYEK